MLLVTQSGYREPSVKDWHKEPASTPTRPVSTGLPAAMRTGSRVRRKGSDRLPLAGLRDEASVFGGQFPQESRDLRQAAEGLFHDVGHAQGGQLPVCVTARLAGHEDAADPRVNPAEGGQRGGAVHTGHANVQQNYGEVARALPEDLDGFGPAGGQSGHQAVAPQAHAEDVPYPGFVID